MISFPSSRSCTIDHALNGTLTMELIVAGDVATGTLRYDGTDAQVAATCLVTRFVSGGWAGNGPVSGTRASLSSRIANSFTSTNDIPVGATNLVQTLAVFEGAFDGTMVNGTFALDALLIEAGIDDCCLVHHSRRTASSATFGSARARN